MERRPLEEVRCVCVSSSRLAQAERPLGSCSTFHRVRCPRPGEYQGARYSIAFFNQARRDAVIQGPAKLYPKITGGEFIALAMKRNFEAAQAKAKAKAYEISQDTLEANKGFEVSGTGLARVKAAV